MLNLPRAAYCRLSTEGKSRMHQAEAVKQLLELCAVQPGAKIQIIVTHKNGLVATANLYDHAALVQGLWDALDYYQSEH